MADVLLKRHRYAPPGAAMFTQMHGTDSVNPTVSDVAGAGTRMNYGSGYASGDRVRLATKAKPAATDYDVVAALDILTWGANYRNTGICVTDGTKIVALSVGSDAEGVSVIVSRWNSQTSFNATPLLTKMPSLWDTLWLRMGVVAGALTNFYFGHNGHDWHHLLSQDQSSFLTFTRIGLYHLTSGWTGDANTTAMINCTYWKDPDVDPGF